MEVNGQYLFYFFLLLSSLHSSLYEEISNRIFHFSLFTFRFTISNRIFHFSLFPFPLNSRSSIVVAVVLPCTDGNVHAAAGLVERYGKGVAFAALEGEGLGQIEVAPIHVHGDKIALCHLLRHDDGVVGRAIVVGCDGRGLSCGRGGGGGQVDGG